MDDELKVDMIKAYYQAKKDTKENKEKLTVDMKKLFYKAKND